MTTAPVHAVADAGELGPQDVVLLSVKAQSLRSALPSLVPSWARTPLSSPRSTGCPGGSSRASAGPARA
ncbi:ketopantoate reductase family protein [Streptacidiphilus monticola]